MATVTRTTNPLPFEHLDPKRFEDLIRQLAYDFRQWQQLEATGRAGSDDGYDARGWEIIGEQPDPMEDNEEDEEDEPHLSPEAKCGDGSSNANARSKSARLRFAPISTQYHGRSARTCTASSSRPAATSQRRPETCCAKNAASWHRRVPHLGQGRDPEDMLFQPKNDGILFAYFGFSLSIRRRSVKTELRARLTTKRKLRRLRIWNDLQTGDASRS